MTIEMEKFEEIFNHLEANKDDPTVKEMKKNIGRLVKFFGVERGDGKVHKMKHEIIGVQKDWTGALCYRVRSTEYDDRFGHVMPLRRVAFL